MCWIVSVNAYAFITCFFKQLKISVYVQSTQPLFKKLLSFVHCFSNILKAIKEFIITMSCKWPVLLSLLTICIFFSNFTHGYEGADSNFHSPPLSGMSFFFLLWLVECGLAYPFILVVRSITSIVSVLYLHYCIILL